MEKWFSTSTNADYQLKEVISELSRSNKFSPSIVNINNDLFGVDNVYDHISHSESTYLGNPNNAHLSQEDLSFLFQRVVDGDIRLVIEVGSFCGASACFIADYFKRKEIPAVIICIDTWCGDINMWLKKDFDIIMSKSDGQPKLFNNFVSTIRKYRVDDVVIPLRVSSVVAARMIEVLGYKVDMVYLDSAHEVGETFMELNLYYNLLKKGGVIFGDDYNIFPAVKHDVDLFSSFISQDIEFSSSKDKNNPIWSFVKK